MPGLYDNEKGEYVDVPGLEHGHWYLDEDDFLYILSNPEHGEYEDVGPGNETEQKLLDYYRSRQFNEVDPEAVAKLLSLIVVQEWQKRFDREVGYFSV